MKRGGPLHVVEALALEQPVLPEGKALEEALRGCVDRRAWLRREGAAEEARLKWLGRRLANERRVAFIRTEAIEREFAPEVGR